MYFKNYNNTKKNTSILVPKHPGMKVLHIGYRVENIKKKEVNLPSHLFTNLYTVQFRDQFITVMSCDEVCYK